MADEIQVSYAEWVNPPRRGESWRGEVNHITFLESAAIVGGIFVGSVAISLHLFFPALVCFCIMGATIVNHGLMLSSRRRAVHLAFDRADIYNPDLQKIVRISFGYETSIYGRDIGLLTIDDEFVHFQGLHIEFSVSAHSMVLPFESDWQSASSGKIVMRDDCRFWFQLHAVEWAGFDELNKIGLKDCRVVLPAIQAVFDRKGFADQRRVLPPRTPPPWASTRGLAMSNFTVGALMLVCWWPFFMYPMSTAIAIAMFLSIAAFAIEWIAKPLRTIQFLRQRNGNPDVPYGL